MKLINFIRDLPFLWKVYESIPDLTRYNYKWVKYIENKYGKSISKITMKDINKYFTEQGADRSSAPVILMQDQQGELPEIVGIKIQ